MNLIKGITNARLGGANLSLWLEHEGWVGGWGTIHSPSGYGEAVVCQPHYLNMWNRQVTFERSCRLWRLCSIVVGAEE